VRLAGYCLKQRYSDNPFEIYGEILKKENHYDEVIPDGADMYILLDIRTI
jgi:hypothetical protein